jgi:hypothetical protein
MEYKLGFFYMKVKLEPKLFRDKHSNLFLPQGLVMTTKKFYDNVRLIIINIFSSITVAADEISLIFSYNFNIVN